MILTTKRIRRGLAAAAVAVLVGLTAAPAAHADPAASPTVVQLSPATDTLPVTVTPLSATPSDLDITIERHLVRTDDVQPADATTCGTIVCQYLTGSGLHLSDWESDAVQPAGTTVCNPTVAFRYDVTTTPEVWSAYSVAPGCYYAPPGYRTTWVATAPAPVDFVRSTWVNAGWNNGWGNSPNAHVF